MNSELPGFYRLSVGERRRRIAELVGLSSTDTQVLSYESSLPSDQADRMVENALGVMGIPLGVCANLIVNGQDRLVPMAVEEPSVIAAASYACKLLRAGGGIHTEVSAPHMIGQIQILDVDDHQTAIAAIQEAKDVLLEKANSFHLRLRAAGGGAIDIETHTLGPMNEDDPLGTMLIVHLLVDVGEAMGANAINSMCERLAPNLETITGGRVRLRILSNLSDRRMVHAWGRVPLHALDGHGFASGRELANGIQEASVFAERDPYRAATHNKGIMNGVDSVLVAFGQDWRAVEAGAHAYAARTGRYTALAQWRIVEDSLEGHLRIPMAVGVVGGVAGVHPNVHVAKRIGHVRTAADLASLTAAVGLAQNLGALRALSAEGIQAGHMRLHARNVAVEAGARGSEVPKVASSIADQGTVNITAAIEALRQLHAA